MLLYFSSEMGKRLELNRSMGLVREHSIRFSRNWGTYKSLQYTRGDGSDSMYGVFQNSDDDDKVMGSASFPHGFNGYWSRFNWS